MSSIISDILVSAKRGSLSQVKDLNESCERLGAKCDELKRSLYWDLRKEFVDYEVLHQPSLELCSQVESRMSEMKELKEKVENAKAQLHLSTQEYSTLKGHLDVTKEILRLLDILAQFHGHLKQARTHLKADKFYPAATTLLATEALLRATSKDTEELKVLSAVKMEMTVLREQIIYEAQNRWKSLVAFSQTQTETELKISTGPEAESKLTDSVDALAAFNILEGHLKRVADQIRTLLVKPAFGSPKDGKYPVLSVDQAGKSSACLRFSSASSPSVFERLESVVAFLRLLDAALFRLTPASRGGATIAALLRPFLTPVLLDDALGALDKTLPRTDGKEPTSLTPEAYSTHVASFSEALRQMSLVDDDDDQRVDAYVNNLPKLCASKQCQDALVKARDLMTANMLDSIEVEGKDGHPLDELGSATMDVTGAAPPSEVEGSILEAIDAQRLQPVLCSPFKMPKCRVSKSVYDLLELAIQTYQAACFTHRDSTGVQLVFTVRKMFELFLDVVPTYHAKLLEDLPLAAALHHNNAMFIAHHITTFGILFRSRLPDALKSTKGGSAAASFIDLILPLRKMAASHFIATMNGLRAQLMDTLKGAKGFAYDPDHPTIGDADRSLRQVHHQLARLAKTWRGVLPDSIYVKAMGLLVNFVVSDVTASILRLEDIGADFALQLFHLLGDYVRRFPRLLKVTDDGTDVADDDEDAAAPVDNLFKLVPKWERFAELRRLLDANLTEIAERWADGKGRLAAVFSAFELKNLVRALFENNEKRARVLKMIE